MNSLHLRYCLLPILISFLFFLDPRAVAAGVPTTVILNKSNVIKLHQPATHVAIADKEVGIIEVTDINSNELLIWGRKIGSTHLVVWEKNAEKPIFFDVTVVGDQDVIEAKIKEYYPQEDIKAEYAKDTLILSGTVANEQTKNKAMEIATAYVASTANTANAAKVLNHITVDKPSQVLLQVKVAQVDKTSMKKLGISTIVKGSTAEGFTNLVGAPSSNTTSSSLGTNTITNGTKGIAGSAPGLGSFDPLDAFSVGVSYFPAGIGAVLQALTTKGLAKILAEPNLLVKSGGDGNFLAGSRIPYSVVVSTGGAATTSIVFENVGIKLKFKPVVSEKGLINLKIDPAEVSSIQGTLAANGYPIIDTRDVSTEVELRDGESLVLAGLLQEEQIRSMSKIPILGDIPILGALFRSTDNELTQKELVFFITPKLVQPTAPGVKIALPTDKKLPPAKEKELDWMPLGE